MDRKGGMTVVNAAKMFNGVITKTISNLQEDTDMSFLPEGFKAEKVEDASFENSIIKGAAVAKLERADRDQGTWPSGEAKDQYSFMWRLTDKIEGNANPNLCVFKKYSMLDSDYKTGAQVRAAMVNDLCTAGYDVDCSSEEAFHASIPGAVGTVANLRLGEYKNGDKSYQTVRVVDKIKVKAAKADVKEEAKEAVPF